MANTVAYGFIDLKHLFADRVSGLSNPQVIDTAVAESMQAYNTRVNQMDAILVRRTTETKRKFLLPGSGTLQPLDDNGIPLTTRVAGSYDVAWPIQGAGDAFGTNRVSRELMTVEEVNRHVLTIQQRDADWRMRHILASLFDNTTWTFDDPQEGNLTIQPLANGDTITYLSRNGTAATANHYVGQAAAIADATNPFPTAYTALSKYAGNEGPFVSYIASDLRSSVEGLADFIDVGDPDVTTGSASDTINGVPSEVLAFGDEVLGKVGRMWIVEWQRLPDDYIVSLALGASEPALAMREYPVASLQGLFEEDHSPDGNRRERRWIRYAGYGAWNRTAAHVTYIGNATYAVPTGYSTPLAI